MENLDRTFDVIVVGSGPAGSIAAKELTERGLDVLLLEAGRDITDADFEPLPPKPAKPLGLDLMPRAKAMLAGQHVQARRSFFSESSNRFLVNDRENPYSTPREAPFNWMRSKILGGRLHAYGRVLQRMSDVDFRAASRDGIGEDWPVDYAEMEPWYARVEGFMGVYGAKDGLTHPPDGVYVGEARLTQVEAFFKDKVAERWPERKVIPWRYEQPNPGRVPRGIAAAQATGRLTLRTDAIVTRITVDDRTGLANGAVFVDRLTKRERRVAADVVMLCASTIETIRLMLNSACGRHPAGLGNANGLLGRYFMDQTISLAFCDVPQYPGFWEAPDDTPDDTFFHKSGGILIPRYENLGPVPEKGFSRGISFQGAGGRFPVPADHPTSFGLGGVGEMLPSFDNRVTLHPRRKDRWGVRIPHIRCAMGPNDRVLVDHQVKALREMVDHAGFQVNFIGSVLGLESKKVWPHMNPVQRLIFRTSLGLSLRIGSAIHECGGARMGNDPASSTLNGRNQVWDVPNLFVTDGAAFTSGSTVGPALTVMALSARAAEFIASTHGSGDLHKASASR